MSNNDTDCTLMLREIMEEPRSLIGAIEQDNDSLMASVTAIKTCRELVLTAAGSSKQAALVGRYLFSAIFGKGSEVDSWIRIQPVDDRFYPLICAAPLQLLSCYLAIARGINPDFPDHMAGLIRIDENGIKLGRVARNRV